VGISAHARQKITVLSRLEARSQGYFLAEGGIKRAAGLVSANLTASGSTYSSAIKQVLHNNPGDYKDTEMESGVNTVFYDHLDERTARMKTRYGVMDEERKINVNKASFDELSRLFQSALGYSEERSRDFAAAIIDWREFGKVKIEGLSETVRYDNLEHPYDPKESPFEVLDELLLVKNIDGDLYNNLINYVTIYGDGQVNINTASGPVLAALGLEEELIKKILAVRRGLDGVEATADDYVFKQPYDITSELKTFLTVEDSESRQIDELNFQNKLTTTSRYFTIKSTGRLTKGGRQKTIRCVVQGQSNRIVYWKE
jgi:general secretion pathway protein K